MSSSRVLDGKRALRPKTRCGRAAGGAVPCPTGTPASPLPLPRSLAGQPLLAAVPGRAGGLLEAAGAGVQRGVSTMCLRTGHSWAACECKAAVSWSVAHGLTPSAERDGVCSTAV